MGNISAIPGRPLRSPASPTPTPRHCHSNSITPHPPQHDRKLSDGQGPRPCLAALAPYPRHIEVGRDRVVRAVHRVVNIVDSSQAHLALTTATAAAAASASETSITDAAGCTPTCLCNRLTTLVFSTLVGGRSMGRTTRPRSHRSEPGQLGTQACQEMPDRRPRDGSLRCPRFLPTRIRFTGSRTAARCEREPPRAQATSRYRGPVSPAGGDTAQVSTRIPSSFPGAPFIASLATPAMHSSLAESASPVALHCPCLVQPRTCVPALSIAFVDQRLLNST